MTVPILNLSLLKEAKNSVIGNPTAKRALARDHTLIETLVHCVNDPTPYIDPSQSAINDIRVETAHVIASLSYGSPDALKGLLNANAHRAFLFAIANFQSADPVALRTAFARAVRALASAIADAVGPTQGGLQIHPSDARDEATVALNNLFELDALDIYLPLLADSSSQISTSIAQLLASTLRLQPYRTAVSEWIPPNERHKEVRAKRGWEKAEPINPSNKQGGWVAKQLIALLQRKDMKLQEAVLSAMGSLAQDNPSVATKLAKAASDQPQILSSVLTISKSRLASLQLAACSCATSIIRAGLPAHALHHDPSAAMTVTHVLSSLISTESETAQTRTRACFILYHLVSDDKLLCKLVYERGILTKLSDLVKSITPTEPPSEWDVDEPESVSTLREVLTISIRTPS
ncbi:hypothetical protein NM688_g8238 [Phlebia brevispora]|uniref:Uncharacterized protein n=1 Tax=Phlebia brevispora TaxID=194682 RepID=A0ACC1RVK7_9APHY|nr:hypothetical protein NM688_g8238 [Phlebia brevispora]